MHITYHRKHIAIVIVGVIADQVDSPWSECTNFRLLVETFPEFVLGGLDQRFKRKVFIERHCWLFQFDGVFGFVS